MIIGNLKTIQIINKTMTLIVSDRKAGSQTSTTVPTWRTLLAPALASSASCDTNQQHKLLRLALGLSEEVSLSAEYGEGLEDGEMCYIPSNLQRLEKLRALPAYSGYVVVDVGGGDGVTAVALATVLRADAAIAIEKNLELATSGIAMASQKNIPLSFQACDAREADYSAGNFFFLYSPFGQETTEFVIRRIFNQTMHHQHVLICTAAVPTRWIKPDSGFVQNQEFSAMTGFNIWNALRD